MSRYLDILEVSKKQAYIFASNKLQDNVRNSAAIALVTDPVYFRGLPGNVRGKLFNLDENYVYAGGGHTILEFSSREKAVVFNKAYTRQAYKDFPDMELFCTICEYDETITPGENLFRLTGKLEEKKSLRKAVFHQGSYGIEQIDSTTLRPVRMSAGQEKDQSVLDFNDRTEHALLPEGYQMSRSFEQIGVTPDKKSYIAVVHIDGNGMGKRVSDFYKKSNSLDWNDFKKAVRNFSESIASDFADALKETCEEISRQMKEGNLEALSLKEGHLPIRRIISSGDDICFVTDGRIGLESAVTFIRKLSVKKNREDGKPYTACAGVALVHQKYPFFSAYTIAEELCSNAKRFGAAVSPGDNGACVCAIDWHMSEGELADDLSRIRKDYVCEDGSLLQMRPYLVNVPGTTPEEILEKEPLRQYEHFQQMAADIYDHLDSDENLRSSLKQMRPAMKAGAAATDDFLRFHKLESNAVEWHDFFAHQQFRGIGSGPMERSLFIKTADGNRRCLLFDAVECTDTFIPFR